MAFGSTLRTRVRNGFVRAGGAVAALIGSGLGRRAVAMHDVPDRKRFAEFLDWVLDEYEVLAMEDWVLAASEPRGRTQVTFTFDDGYASWHDSVAPLLEEREIPAVFFVSSGLVGLHGEAARDFARRRLRRTRALDFIGLADLRALATHRLFEVGGHTRTHASLGRIPDRQLVTEEISSDRARLEDWLAAQVRWFAYPFGTPADVSPLARSVLEELGMSAAFTLVPGWWEPERGDRLAIGRDGVDPALPFGLWRAWLRGGYDGLYRVKGRRPGAHSQPSAQ
jgi:peptidoglycan/xylan/chitin deacetylase (PgdA/CDA1 family)